MRTSQIQKTNVKILKVSEHTKTDGEDDICSANGQLYFMLPLNKWILRQQDRRTFIRYHSRDIHL